MMKQCSVRACVRILLLAGACLISDLWSGVLGAAESPSLAFVGSDNGAHTFDTGVLRGVLHDGGKSTGLLPVSDASTGKTLTKSMGWLSPYRVLSTGTQHGYAAWDWMSEATRLPDGAVEVRWQANDTYPLDLTAVYRWSAPNSADVIVTAVPRRDLSKLEIFVASYFEGFNQSQVYARDAGTGKARFVPLLEPDGVWHVFPRDAAAAEIVNDGRWQHPPAPVAWIVRDPMAGTLGMRRNTELGLTALVMSPPGDCFAVYSPFGDEAHGSLYVSLLGRDVKAGEAAHARVRLVIARDLTDQQAIEIHEQATW